MRSFTLHRKTALFDRGSAETGRAPVRSRGSQAVPKPCRRANSQALLVLAKPATLQSRRCQFDSWRYQLRISRPLQFWSDQAVLEVSQRCSLNNDSCVSAVKCCALVRWLCMTNEIALKQASADWDISQAIASELKRPWNRKGRMWRSLGLVKGLSLSSWCN